MFLVKFVTTLAWLFWSWIWLVVASQSPPGDETIYWGTSLVMIILPVIALAAGSVMLQSRRRSHE